jgi:hypothetical protein
MSSSLMDLCHAFKSLNVELTAFLMESKYLHAEHVPSDIVIEIAPEFDYSGILQYDPIEDIKCTLITIKRAFEQCVQVENNMLKTNSLDVHAQFKLMSELSESQACVASMLNATRWSNVDKFMLDDISDDSEGPVKKAYRDP